MRPTLIYAIFLMAIPLIKAADSPISISKLPLYDEQKVSLKTDWLIDNRGGKAGLYDGNRSRVASQK